jgi:flagellar P-ring protein precursor FlgI
MKKTLLLAFLLMLFPTLSHAIRIKELAAFDGVRDNQLIGYGLVVGLNGTGDGNQVKFQIQSLVNALERMGVTINRADVDVKNVAAVMVTATLPPFARQGGKLDVLVSSMGDAKSLAGGTLLMTPLKGADNQVYAVAQGPVVTSSFSYGGQAASAQKNHPTTGMISAGALVERELPNALADRSQLKLNLQKADFTTSARITAAVNQRFNAAIAASTDPGSIMINIPPEYQGRTVEFVSELERLDVRPDAVARVVLNERTGTIVMGENVRISSVAVSHGNLTLFIRETPQVSQPLPYSKGETKEVPRTQLKVTEDAGGLALLREGASIGDVVRGLNALGVTPRDLIGIMQAIKASGALQAELVII